MLDREYKILGLSADATDEQIDKAYFELKAKYEEDRFLDGEEGNRAAQKLTELNSAYDEIKNYRSQRSGAERGEKLSAIDQAIKDGDLMKAQQLLDEFDERSAEWHYLQSVVFYKKNWMNECKKQLEIAKQMDASNEKYSKTYDRLIEKMNANANGGATRGGNDANGNQNRYASYSENGDNAPQMGGDSCFDFCCRMAICNLCLNCLCNCR
ncbi:MAG: J domain-containing protein [Clostridia bacterium]|nr:J domain-containing protein [Clostridia bacterium]